VVATQDIVEGSAAGEKPETEEWVRTGCAWVCGEVGWRISGAEAAKSGDEDATLIESVVLEVPIFGARECDWWLSGKEDLRAKVCKKKR